MSAGPGEPSPETRPPRLNPFAFPSETTFRFLLLVVSVVGVSLFLYNWLYFSFSDRHHEVAQTRACLDARRVNRDLAQSRADLAAANAEFSSCLRAIDRPKAAFMLGGVGVLLATAAAIALSIPAVKLRRRRLVPFTADDSPEVLAEVERLARISGLRTPPALVWDPLDPGVSGLAFGRPGERYVAVSGGLVVQHAVDPPAFRAVVLHELGHLRNRDVDATYFTVAIWYAFLAVGVAPFLPTLLDESADTILSIGWRLAALTALVYLSRNSVLRAREAYADLRAFQAEPDGALGRILRAMRERRRRGLDRLLAKHPPPEARARLLDSTDALFSLGLLEAFGTGVAATIAYQEVGTLVGFGGFELLSSWWISALVFAPLAVGVVGLGVWRAAFAAMARARPTAEGWWLGAALGAGLLVGQELSLSSALTSQDTVLNAADPTNIVWAAAAVAGLAAFVAWLSSSASVWLPVAGPRSPTWVLLAAFIAGSFVLTIGLGLYLFAHATREAIHVSTASTARDYHAVAAVVWPGPEYAFQFVQDPELALFAHKALVWIGVLALWAFPLAAAAGRRGAAVPPAWGFLDRGGAALRRPRIELARAALIGAVGAAAVLAGMLLLRLGVHAAVSASRRSQLEYRLAFYVWTVSLVLLAQGVVAAVTAARIRRLAIPLALFAAFLTALGGVVAVTAYPSIASCVGPLSVGHSACDWSIDGPTARFTFVQVVVDGAVVALLFAAAACGGAALWRSMRGYDRGQ